MRMSAASVALADTISSLTLVYLFSRRRDAVGTTTTPRDKSHYSPPSTEYIVYYILYRPVRRELSIFLVLVSTLVRYFGTGKVVSVGNGNRLLLES